LFPLFIDLTLTEHLARLLGKFIEKLCC